jgi:nitroimidazol reductase NimA-like FMN-containing flavoprotein (pyridoxamine 5'-phosphate oxidase superfamily)
MASQPADDLEVMLEEIDHAGCAMLMAATQFGRIAVVESKRPVIVVLNHLVLGGDVVFRVGAGSRLARLTDGDSVPASYEVDSAFPVGHSGWSVIATGLLGREADHLTITAAQTQIVAWAGGKRDTVLRLRVEQLTGRRAGHL